MKFITERALRLAQEISIDTLRLVVLIGIAIGIIYGGYYVFEQYLSQTVQMVWGTIAEYWAEFSLAALWRGMVTWVLTMTKTLPFEVIKRGFLVWVVPWFAVFLLPPAWRVWLRRTFEDKKEKLAERVANRRERSLNWLHRNFGRHAPKALWTIVAIVASLVFYFSFSIFAIFFFGWIKAPAFIATVFSFIGGKVGWLAQKLPFRNLAFKLFGKLSSFASRYIWPFFLRFLPRFRWVRPLLQQWGLLREETEEERAERVRKRLRQRARWTIRKRKKKEAWLERTCLWLHATQRYRIAIWRGQRVYSRFRRRQRWREGRKEDVDARVSNMRESGSPPALKAAE